MKILLFFVLLITTQIAICEEAQAPQRTFRWKGVEYKSIDDFWATKEGMEILAERQIKKLNEEYDAKIAEERHQQNVRSLAAWKSGRYPDAYRREDERVQSLTRKAMGEWWWIRHKEPHIFDEKAPSYQAVAKVAKKYNIGQRQAWENHTSEVLLELNKSK